MPSETSKKACCLISEVLEEAGLDRRKARALRRQLLQGVVTLCQWQLARMEEEPAPAAAGKSSKKARKVSLD